MTSPAFRKAEAARKRHRGVSAQQRRTLASLSRKAGIEPPQVHSSKSASDALDRLKDMLASPTLEGFSASTSSPAVVRDSVCSSKGER